MTRPTDDDQRPALPRHTTDAEIGAAMTKQVALLRASKGGAKPAARQEGWNAAIEAAAQVVDNSSGLKFYSYAERERVANSIRSLAEKGSTHD